MGTYLPTVCFPFQFGSDVQPQLKVFGGLVHGQSAVMSALSCTVSKEGTDGHGHEH